MKAEISIDYLTFTVRGIMNPNEVIETVLEMDSALFEDTGKGFNFYKSSKHYNNITVRYNGHGENDIDMGISVCMSGQGVSAFEEYHGKDILFLLRKIDDSTNMRVSRIDIACDDKAGFLDMDSMWNSVHDGNYRSRVRTASFHEGRKNSVAAERTIYIGSRSSLCLIRIYDKAKETYNVKYEPDLYYSHWLRFEMELKDIYAMQAVTALVNTEDIGATVAGLINDRFTFIDLDDTNISRCTVSKWWRDFLEAMSNVAFQAKGKVKHTIDETVGYVAHAWARNLAKIIDAIGEDKFIREVLDRGKKKLTEADKKQIQDYKDKQDIDFWQPIFGRVSRGIKRRLGEQYKNRENMGDLWQGENGTEISGFVELPKSTPCPYPDGTPCPFEQMCFK